MNTEKKKDIKFIIIFIIIITLSFTYLFQASYAKYRKQVNAEVDAEIASWNIQINNEDIGKKKTLTNKIEPVFPGDEFTNEGVIAPGSIGYFDLIINAINVDVDFTYELTAEPSTTSSISDLKINSYIINPSETNTTQIPYTNGTKLTNTIVRNTPSTTIRMYIEWNDTDEQTMDNSADTDVGVDQNSKALINVTFNFYQKNN